jgi:hypothetical protein
MRKAEVLNHRSIRSPGTDPAYYLWYVLVPAGSCLIPAWVDSVALRLRIGDQPGNLGVWPHRLYQNNVVGVDHHPVRGMPLRTAAADQNVLRGATSRGLAEAISRTILQVVRTKTSCDSPRSRAAGVMIVRGPT